jgi:hypothetical protein
MKKFAKLKQEAFVDALNKDLITQGEFAEKIGSNQSYLCRISSDSPSGSRCSIKFIRRVLQGFKVNYGLDDLFYYPK